MTTPLVGKAAVLNDLSSGYEVVEREAPKPGRGEALVQINFSGCCYTDTQARFPSPTDPPSRRPHVGGHEGAGVIVALGEGVERKDLVVGSRVGMGFTCWTCGSCETCLDGAEAFCPSALANGFEQDGTFQRYISTQASHLIPIPEGLADEQTAPLMCGGATVFSALLTSGVTAGQWVAIPGGGGGLGHLAIQYAKAMGARVVAIDLPSKEEFCRDTCGAEEFVDATSASLVDEVVRVTGGGPHVTIVTSYRAYESAFNFARVRGTVMLVAMGVTSLDTTVAVIKGLRLIGTSTASRALTTRALEVAARAGVKAQLEIRRLEDVERTMVDLKEGRISGRVVIDMTL